MPTPAITTEGLTRLFGSHRAVDELTLHVPRGAVYGFLGPNGAGKTTTIRMLLGLIRPSSGTVALLGNAVAADHLRALRPVGAMVETPSLYGHLTGRENLRVQCAYLGCAASECDRVLALLDLTGAAERPVNTYSLGMRQRLGLAQALLSRPELLILDEPTNGLDPAGMMEMREFIRTLAAKDGVTVFLSSHLLAEVEQVASHIGILREGRLLFEGTLSDLQSLEGLRLEVEASPVEVAVELLRSRSYAARRTGARVVEVPITDPAEAGRINHVLVDSGVTVTRLAVQRQSLEEIFLTLTDGQRRSAA